MIEHVAGKLAKSRGRTHPPSQVPCKKRLREVASFEVRQCNAIQKGWKVPVYREPTRVSKYTSRLEQAREAHEQWLENCPEDTAGVDLAGAVEINGGEGENQ